MSLIPRRLLWKFIKRGIRKILNRDIEGITADQRSQILDGLEDLYLAGDATEEAVVGVLVGAGIDAEVAADVAAVIIVLM